MLATLDRAGQDGLTRDALRQVVRVRNQNLGESLTRLAQAGHITRRGDLWIRLPVPVPELIDTGRNGNGNREHGMSD